MHAIPSIFLASALTFALSLPTYAAEKKSLCVYDPGGGNGDIFNMMKDYRTSALGWGVDFTMKPYTDEKTAAEDFKAGQCDAVLMTGTRVRQFHQFAGTIEAMGALPQYDQLKRVLGTLAKPQAEKLMKSGDYEIAGVFPGGAVYLIVRDRTVDKVSELAGRRLATLEYDDAAKVMVRQVGAGLVAADVGTFAGMFNNGSVDACYAPATAYKALELYKGVGTKGGVIRYPLAQVTLQLLVRSANVPAAYPQASRAHAAKNFDVAMRTVVAAEKEIPKAHWIDIPDADKAKYDEMFLDVRVRLRDKEKIYNPTTLTLLRKVRCGTDASRAECAEKRE